MKPRKVSDLMELSESELHQLLHDSKETLAKQRFQHALKQLTNTSYLNILKHDIARINTIINERSKAAQNGK